MGGEQFSPHCRVLSLERMQVELVDIYKRFGSIRANDGISLTLQEGTIHGLLGENGAGKTTLMKVLSGYQSVPSMTVLDNFLLGHDSGLFQKRRAGRREMLAFCKRLGFPLDPGAPTNTLTVGERQQLEIIRLLSLKVRLIIFDEPTTGISASQKTVLFETLHSLAKEGLSIIFVSHKLAEIEELCSEVTVLVLEMDDVSVHTYRLNIENVSLKVCEGEIIGLAGLEGSGQRIMMQACAGIQKIASGRLLIANRDMTHRPYHRFLEMGIAFVPASRLEEGMVPGLTIREHVALAGKHKGPFVHWQDIDAQADDMISEFNVMGRPATQVQELSGGNQQRTLLALLPDDLRLLILEHPTRGLDLESTRWVWNKLLERREQETAILFTSTDLDELVENSDRIIVFSGGSMSAPSDAATMTGEKLGFLIGGQGI